MEGENNIEKFYGKITVEPKGEYIAGTDASLNLTYTAGIYGMDDLGGLKVLFRFACDQSPLQMDDPKGVGYTTATASNGAKIELDYYLREGERPWYKMLRVRIAGEGLKQGESITIKLGDTSKGSPGIRLQTFVEPRFEFKTLVDVFSTNVFKYLPSPEIALISGEPVSWKAYLPTVLPSNKEFSLKIRAEDKWGNPSDKCANGFFLKSTMPIVGLPESFKWVKGSATHVIDNLKIMEGQEKRSIVRINIMNKNEEIITSTNPLILEPNPQFLHFWGDIHGQSEETIGSNTARMYFEFARDKAFLDVAGHQGNDFQVTKDLWKLVNSLSEEFNESGRFVTLIGYEYSANTALGGDRNVYFLHPNRQIHRSSHALIPDKSDIDTDSLSAGDLFVDLINNNLDADDAVLVNAHVGGRYADIKRHHDGRLESSVEIHSAWGTFEWLLQDAFKMGYRMGIVANSDDHKGRPGSAYPGASKFGALGGFTCFLTSKLTREAIFKALKQRRHYATTGERIYLDVQGILSFEGLHYERDPAIFKDAKSEPCKTAYMGDIIGIPGDIKQPEVNLKISVEASSPIVRIDIFNGMELLQTIRPYLTILDSATLQSNRIRIQWEGAEFRARRRNVNWIGTAEFVNNEIEKTSTFNFWNIDNPLKRESSNKVSWNTVTSGNFQGFDVFLSDEEKGTLVFKSSQVSFELPISSIGCEDTIFEAGGLGKRVRVFKLPINNLFTSFGTEFKMVSNPGLNKDDRLYVRVTLENGHQAWSSPIYFIK